MSTKLPYTPLDTGEVLSRDHIARVTLWLPATATSFPRFFKTSLEEYHCVISPAYGTLVPDDVLCWTIYPTA